MTFTMYREGGCDLEQAAGADAAVLADGLSSQQSDLFPIAPPTRIRATSTMREIGAWLVLSLLILLPRWRPRAFGSSRREVRDLINDESSSRQSR